MKYLGRNVTKYVQDLSADNYRTLVRESREEMNTWRAKLCARIGRLSGVKISSLPLPPNCAEDPIIPNKNPAGSLFSVFVLGGRRFEEEIDKLVLKFTWQGNV